MNSNLTPYWGYLDWVGLGLKLTNIQYDSHGINEKVLDGQEMFTQALSYNTIQT